jgi:hypothetical protein
MSVVYDEMKLLMKFMFLKWILMAWEFYNLNKKFKFLINDLILELTYEKNQKSKLLISNQKIICYNEILQFKP